MNKLNNPATATQKGTLSHLRNYFNHRGVKKDVSASFNHTSEFLTFVTEEYICLLALDMLGIDTLDDFPDNDDSTKIILDKVASALVEMVWVRPDLDKVTGDDTGGRRGYCVCEDGTQFVLVFNLAALHL